MDTNWIPILSDKEVGWILGQVLKLLLNQVLPIKKMCLRYNLLRTLKIWWNNDCKQLDKVIEATKRKIILQHDNAVARSFYHPIFFFHELGSASTSKTFAPHISRYFKINKLKNNIILRWNINKQSERHHIFQCKYLKWQI